MTDPASPRPPRVAADPGPSPGRIGAAIGLWVLLAGLVVGGLLFDDDADFLRRLAEDWLPGAAVTWLLVVATLATVRRPGVAPGLEGLLVGWGLSLGLVANAGLLLFLLGGVVHVSSSLAPALVLLLLVLGLGVLVAAGALAVVWTIFVVELTCLPRGEPSLEAARVAHVAAPGLVAVALGTSAVADDVRAAALVQVPAPLAVALTLGAVIVGASLWLRLRAARREPA